jgi:hypothetical protein
MKECLRRCYGRGAGVVCAEPRGVGGCGRFTTAPAQWRCWVTRGPGMS